MKKIPWGGIIGGFLILCFLVGGVTNIIEPTKFKNLNIANAVSSLVWICFGIFLLTQSFKKKNQDNKVGDQSQSNDEDALLNKRNKVIFYLIVLTFIYSISSWILNDYSTGLTLRNISVIFDLVATIILLVLVIGLFRGKNVISKFFYMILVYATVGAILFGLRGNWANAVAYLLFGSYFVYAIKSPLTPKSFKVTNFIILPLIIVLTAVAILVDSATISRLLKEKGIQEQQLSNNADDINAVYASLTEKLIPTQKEIAELEKNLNIRNNQINDIVDLLNQIKIEYEDDIASEDQIRSLDNINNIFTELEIHRAQALKLQELINYYKSLNLNFVSESQQTYINDLMVDIEDFNRQFRDLELKIESE